MTRARSRCECRYFQLKTPGTIPMTVHIFACSQKDYPGSLTIVQLNKTYATVIAKAEKDRVSLVREAQRAWIKRRDEGVKLYISLFPQAERERRRLQFLGDVTAGRIDNPFDYWELM
jgi:uncharacterized protein YecT (DUF1311 family)